MRTSQLTRGAVAFLLATGLIAVFSPTAPLPASAQTLEINFFVLEISSQQALTTHLMYVVSDGTPCAIVSPITQCQARFADGSNVYDALVDFHITLFTLGTHLAITAINTWIHHPAAPDCVLATGADHLVNHEASDTYIASGSFGLWIILNCGTYASTLTLRLGSSGSADVAISLQTQHI